MATVSKIIAFQAKFKEFMELQITEIGVGKDILHKIVEEEITKVKSIGTIEAMLLASAVKAAATTPAKIISTAPSTSPAKAPGKAVSPTLTINVSPEGERSIRYSSVVAPPREAGGAVAISEASASKSLMRPPTIASWGDAVIAGGAGAPRPAAAAAAAPAAAPPREAKGETAAAAADLPAWKVDALKEFTSSSAAPFKKEPKIYSFYLNSISKIHTSLFKLLTERGVLNSMMEWIHALEPSAFSAWLEDTETRAIFNDDSIRFTLSTTMYKFIPFFGEHNLKEKLLTHLIHCIGYVMTSEPTTSESCSTYFGLSPGEKPSEEILREVAMIQAIQRYVLSNVNTLLESAKDKSQYKILSVENDLSGIKVSFRSEDAMKKFTDAMHYDRRDHGPLGRRVYNDRRGTNHSV